MTPDDVVARARELEGQEVLLTVRGVVIVDQGVVGLTRDNGLWTTLTQAADHASPSLVSIEPAPLRIEPGELYADEQGVVYVGITEREARAVTGPCRGSTTTSVEGLRRVKVVDA